MQHIFEVLATLIFADFLVTPANLIDTEVVTLAKLLASIQIDMGFIWFHFIRKFRVRAVSRYLDILELLNGALTERRQI